MDFSDKPLKLPAVDDVPDDLEAEWEEVLDVKGDKGSALDEFFERCNGRMRAVVVRAGLHDALKDEAEFAKLPPALVKAIQYAGKFLQVFNGHTHTMTCCTCGNDIECSGENDHQEVGCFMVAMQHDLDDEAGAVVFGVCKTCEALPDDVLYNKFQSALEGEQPSTPAESQLEKQLRAIDPAELSVLRRYNENMGKAAAELLSREIDAVVFLEKCAALALRMRDELIAAKGWSKDAPKPEVCKDAVNLLMGKE